VKGLLTLAPLQIAQALVGLGAIAAFTRLMSAEEFGLYALVLSASMLAHTLVFTWAEAAAFRFLPAARAEGRLADHFATLMALVIAIGAIVLIATAAILALLGVEGNLFALAVFAVGAGLLRFVIRIARESDRAALDIGRYATFETIYLMTGFAIGIALLMRFDLGGAAPFAGLFFAGALVLIVDAPRLFAQARGGATSPARAISYAGYGTPLALALAIDLGVQTAVRFILAAEAGASEVGAFAAAFGLARPLDLIFMTAGAAFSPLLLAAYEARGAAAVRAPAQQGFALMAALGAPAAIGLALVAAPLSTLLVGSTLSAEAARALPWLAIAGLLSGVNLYYLSEAFQLTRRTGLRALVMLAPGAVQLVLTAALANQSGAVGAAMGAAAGACAGSVLLFCVGRSLLALPLPLASLARIAGATAAMAAAVLAIPGEGAAHFALQVGAGVAAYALAAFALDVAAVRSTALSLVRRRTSLALTGQTHAS
jgi:O-antigen/teichoic acid export membrane protein